MQVPSGAIRRPAGRYPVRAAHLQFVRRGRACLEDADEALARVARHRPRDRGFRFRIPAAGTVRRRSDEERDRERRVGEVAAPPPGREQAREDRVDLGAEARGVGRERGRGDEGEKRCAGVGGRGRAVTSGHARAGVAQESRVAFVDRVAESRARDRMHRGDRVASRSGVAFREPGACAQRPRRLACRGADRFGQRVGGGGVGESDGRERGVELGGRGRIVDARGRVVRPEEERAIRGPRAVDRQRVRREPRRDHARRERRGRGADLADPDRPSAALDERRSCAGPVRAHPHGMESPERHPLVGGERGKVLRRQARVEEEPRDRAVGPVGGVGGEETRGEGARDGTRADDREPVGSGRDPPRRIRDRPPDERHHRPRELDLEREPRGHAVGGLGAHRADHAVAERLGHRATDGATQHAAVGGRILAGSDDAAVEPEQDADRRGPGEFDEGVGRIGAGQEVGVEPGAGGEVGVGRGGDRGDGRVVPARGGVRRVVSVRRTGGGHRCTDATVRDTDRRQSAQTHHHGGRKCSGTGAAERWHDGCMHHPAQPTAPPAPAPRVEPNAQLKNGLHHAALEPPRARRQPPQDRAARGARLHRALLSGAREDSSYDTRPPAVLVIAGGSRRGTRRMPE